MRPQITREKGNSAVEAAPNAFGAAIIQQPQATRLPLQSPSRMGFTLAELLVSLGVLVLLVLLFTQLLNSATRITTLGHKQMDTDSEARQVLDRMAIDLAQMVKRPDLDYYLKSPSIAADCNGCGPQAGSDQITFFSAVPGYFATGPTSTQKSPISLISYRVNPNLASSAYNRMERLGKGLAWNGVSAGWPPIMFLPQTILTVMLSTADSDYEVIGPEIFRFEYYYLLKNGSLSVTPWYTNSKVSGMQGVAAIVADIAVIDPKSRALLNNSAQIPPPNDNITLLVAALADYNGQAPGGLLARWRTTLDNIIAIGRIGNTNVPRPAIQGIRLYERFFYLSPPTL
jgi:type II secretory pathway pseudopilin PulG